MITFDYHGYCDTQGCANEGLWFDAPSLDGVLQRIGCGICGADFTHTCVPKE
jgi:hypothetical protein